MEVSGGLWRVLEGFCRSLEGSGGFLQVSGGFLEGFCRVLEGSGGLTEVSGGFWRVPEGSGGFWRFLEVLSLQHHDCIFMAGVLTAECWIIDSGVNERGAAVKDLHPDQSPETREDVTPGSLAL